MPEYAFTGRSNVGKSSLINMLTNNSKLARISAQPGKTQTINHFMINNEWYLVDLPGYGFAKAAKSRVEKWVRFINTYIQTRENLMCLFLLVDARLTPQRSDLDFMLRLGDKQIPFVIVFTKTDKISNNELTKNIIHYKKVLKEFWSELPRIFITSSEKYIGREEILDFIEATNPLFVRANKPDFLFKGKEVRK